MPRKQTEALSVLIIDDDAMIGRSLALNIGEAGFSVKVVEDAVSAMQLISPGAFDVILCDYRMPGLDGMEFIKQCKEISPDIAVILMTGFGSTELAIKALKAGAYDYISKPFQIEELIFRIRKIEERKNLKTENTELKSEIDRQYNFSNMIAHSDSMGSVFETVKRISNFATTVLIRGESGTGKELLARAIHYNSPRKQEKFVAINCGAIPENLMESELFGHKKGAFTDAVRDKTGLIEEANGGTLFLDEIGEMSPHLQVKLLRVVQERQVQPVGSEEVKEIDVRIIAATLRDLEGDVKSGRFRKDLYYRLNVVNLELPPLRDRSEDIPVLTEHFIEKLSRRLGMEPMKVTPAAMGALISYSWRGNVRELENCIERALVLSDSGEIDIDSLPENLRSEEAQDDEQEASGDRVVLTSSDSLSIKSRTKELEKQLITRALKETDGNRTQAAKLLELSHRALLYKIKEYGFEKLGK